MNITDIIAAYNKSAKEYAKNRQGKEPKELFDFLAMLPPGGRILDVGCAAGRDTHIIKQRGFEVVGVDLSEKLLEIAKATYPDLEFILADMSKLPLADASFDGVWANAVLHHLDKQAMPAALLEFKRVLKPGGILCISTKMGTGKLKTKENIVEHEEREFTLLSAEELAALLADAGYTKIKLERVASKSRENLFWLTAFYKK